MSFIAARCPKGCPAVSGSESGFGTAHRQTTLKRPGTPILSTHRASVSTVSLDLGEQ